MAIVLNKCTTLRCPRINLCISKTLAPNMSHDSLSSSRPLSNIQKRTISICEVAKLAFDSNMFREQIQDISNKYKYDKRSIATNINRGIASGSLKEKQRPGRPYKLDEIQLAELNSFIIAKKGNVTRLDIFDHFNWSFCEQTLSKTLNKLEYYSFKKVRVQLLLAKDKTTKLKWCLSKADCTLEDWRLCCFSDESTFRKMWDDNQRVWIKDGGPTEDCHYKQQTAKAIRKITAMLLMRNYCLFWASNYPLFG